MKSSIEKFVTQYEPLEVSQDPIVENVVKQYRDRSNLGVGKYGTTLEENKAPLLEWLQHLQEELMDAVLYVERLKKEIQWCTLM